MSWKGIFLYFKIYKISRSLNELFLRGAFKDEFLEEFYRNEPVKIPRSFIEKEDKPYYIPFIEMSHDLQKSLNYESKLDRSPKLIKQLIEDGKQQAKKFLETRLNEA